MSASIPLFLWNRRNTGLAWWRDQPDEYIHGPKVTQGLADYLKTQSDHPSVVIGYDSRHYSDVFAKEAALAPLRTASRSISSCFEAGAHDQLRGTESQNHCRNRHHRQPQPLRLQRVKAYWRDGAQTLLHDFQIADRANAVLPKHLNDCLKKSPSIIAVCSTAEESYYNEVLSSIRNMDIIKTSKTPRCVYSLARLGPQAGYPALR